MLHRALEAWLALVGIAFFNGAVRELLLVPAIGDTAGRAASTLLLSAAILVLAWLTIRWIGPDTAADAWRIGGLWLVLTLAFEFGAGHYLFGNSWERLLEDYHVLRGRIWILVLVTTAAAPSVVWRARRG